MWFYTKIGKVSQISEQHGQIKILRSIQKAGIFTIGQLNASMCKHTGALRLLNYEYIVVPKVEQYDWWAGVTSLPCRNLTFVSTSFLSNQNLEQSSLSGNKRIWAKINQRRGQVRLCTPAILWNSNWPQSPQEAIKCYLYSNAPQILS